jgi:hypothetical protein
MRPATSDAHHDVMFDVEVARQLAQDRTLRLRGQAEVRRQARILRALAERVERAAPAASRRELRRRARQGMVQRLPGC